MAKPGLNEYMRRVQRIVGDQRFDKFNPYDIEAFINEARGIVASEGECVRILCPSTSGIQSITINTAGSSYTSAPTVTISPPVTGATPTATAFVNIGTGQVVAINITNPGSGYPALSPPSVTLSGGGGSGATASAVLGPSAQCIAGKEVYNFQDFTSLILSTGTGAEKIIAISNIAISWGSLKPMLDYVAWGDFQAFYRSYNVGAQGFSVVWSMYQRGTTGNFYLWPIPSQNAQMDLDCICIPQDLDATLGDAGVEPIPYPYSNAVPYKAAELMALANPDMKDLVDRCAKHYTARMQFAAATVYPHMVPSYYSSAARV